MARPLEFKAVARPGRPALGVIERARAATWARAVVADSGMTAFGLESLLRGDRGFKASKHASGAWYKYLKGRASPSVDVLALTEARFPGSLANFDHSLWRLAGEGSLDNVALGQAVSGLPKRMRRELMQADSIGGAQFWRKARLDVRAVTGRAVAARNIDGLAAILALMRDAELRQDQRQHLTATIAWSRFVQIGRDVTLLDGLYPDFMALIGRRFINANHWQRDIQALKGRLLSSSQAWLRKFFSSGKRMSADWLEGDIEDELMRGLDPQSLLVLHSISARRIM